MTRAAVAALALASAVLPVHALEPTTREVYLMGTRARLVTWAATRAEALDILDAAVRVLENAEAELSTWRPGSAVSRLNRHPLGQPWQSTPGLCEALPALYRWHAATAGAFDPAVGRLTDAWGIHADGRVPEPAALAAARSASGLHRLDFDRERCQVTRRGDVTLDVGAFGKGDALDRVARSLGEAAWLIDLGGQVSVNGTPPNQAGWQLSVAHPLHRDRPWLDVRIREGSLATSAGSERDLTVSDRRVGHILDPRTGQPATFTGSVTVWHRSGLAADALSTALFVMGPDGGLRWAEARGIAACYLIPHPDGRVVVRTTGAFRPLIVS